jgi:DNA-3-methyladenine glycosylase
MAARRRLPTTSRDLSNGPGKLCQAFGIGKADYGADLCGKRLYLADGPRVTAQRSARIGIDYAEDWAEKPWRFFDAKSRYVSRARP